MYRTMVTNIFKGLLLSSYTYIGNNMNFPEKEAASD